MERTLISIPGAREELGGICRSSIYNLIRAGKLGTVKIGNRRMIRTDSIRALVGEV